MTRKITLSLAVLLIAAPLVAQRDVPQTKADRFLRDNDDGQVEVWRAGDPVRSLAAADAIRQPLFAFVFAGAWTPADRDAVVSSVTRLAVVDGVQPATVAGSIAVDAPAVLNDLDVQRIIADAIASGALPMRGENVIYVVAIGPNVRSTLGAFASGADYDSYHSRFQAHDVGVNYVVAAADGDADRCARAIANSAVRVIVHPGR